ncbi:hypothetical protein M8C13_07610 [Crossiella sp. SN42]|uniref:hypothetical protein n=1 Tax=Crossiella sp. SN42 TaxID=2944808 RepID=UPI00207D3F2A|nr:hypothetical protein [Crossiella sp. SN42]MCO1575624.1 hypothetical protein [Crossiella sp. SN42]
MVDTSNELQARASQLGRLTYRQFQTIRDLAAEAGLAPQVAAVTAWLAADPQEAISQLKRPRVEAIAAGITARVLDIDVLTAPLVRAPENLRMGGKRYEGLYLMPAYTCAPDNSALLLRLESHRDVEAAMQFYFTELAKVDAEVGEQNQYGDDIRTNGIRVGGTLFPLVIEFAGHAPGVAGWETADSYGRTYFTQDAEGIEAADVLQWMSMVPVDGSELARHPLFARRNELLAIAGKVLSGTRVSRGEAKKLRRAVMPRTRVILSVDSEVPLDEIRRRVVALQHLDRPTPFSAATDWQTRAEAVLTMLQHRGKFVGRTGQPSDQIRRWLDHPVETVAAGCCESDDLAMIAVASLLASPRTYQDKLISNALKTRGVAGSVRTNARTEVVAHVVARALRGRADADSRRAALERALQWKPLHDQAFDSRPIPTLLTEALAEVQAAALERSLGNKAGVGPAQRQLATRALFHLICAPPGQELLLPFSPHGAKGQSTKPDHFLTALASTPAGLHQLAQAIFDGRRSLPVRRVPVGAHARELAAEAPHGELLTADDLRTLALTDPAVITDASAAAKVATDSLKLRKLLEQAHAVVTRLGTHTDSLTPFVELHGWSDPDECIPLLQELVRFTGYWQQLHQVVNRQRPAVGLGSDRSGSR